SLSTIFLMNVLHHIPDLESFFHEASRCLRPGGAVVLFEPANTWWSRLIYRRLHHEPFEPGASQWSLPPGGPLSMANGALPWIVFCRDRDRFHRTFARLRVEKVRHCFPVSYLVSGGLSARQLLPGFCFGLVRLCEALTAPLACWLGMFMRVVVRKMPDTKD